MRGWLRFTGAALVAAALCGAGLGESQISSDGADGTMSTSGTVPELGGQSIGKRPSACPAYPSTPNLWFDASQETAYSDNDPAQPPTNFGSNGDTFATSASSTSPTYQSPCDNGSSTACFYHDGGDRFYDADSSLSAYKYIHDGTGVTCLAVYDIPSTAAAMTVGFTSNVTGAEYIGATLQRNGTLNRDQIDTYNATPATITTDFDSNAEDVVHLMVISHGSSRSPDAEIRWDGVQSVSADYSATPGTGNSGGRFTVGSRPNTLSALTGYTFEIACWDSAMTTAELEAIETVASCKWTADAGFPLVSASGFPLVSASLAQPMTSTTSVRSRGLRAAFALVQQGYKPAQVIPFVASRLGVDEQVAREEVRKVWGRRKDGRIDATLRTEHVGILVPTAEMAMVREVIAWTLCYPLGNCEDGESLADCRARDDQTFEPLLTQCLQRERQSLGERYCSAGTSREVGRGDRMWLTSEQWDKMVEADGDAPAHPGTRVVRDATDERYLARQQAMGIERCQEATP